MLSVRLARPEEAEALTQLCMRSKASHGYDAEFMRRCEPVLRIAADDIADACVWVAERRGIVVGVASIAAIGDGCVELENMFVEPDAFGMGVGRVLMLQALAAACKQGHSHMRILADPHAAGFYENFDAIKVGDEPSDAIPGRTLPRYEIALPRAQAEPTASAE